MELARVGAGTQRLEGELERRLPGLERIRLDADTTAKPGALREALERFAKARAAALIGTQMVAKGHHFPGVAVAAVVDADTGMAFPDFRAEERTFQLVTQLAGRSGRDAPGKVLVQTFQPDATPLAFAVSHDVAGFLAQELARRKELEYPPFSHLVSISVSGPEQDSPLRALRELRDALELPRRPADRAGAASSPSRPLPGAARREDVVSARVREPRGCTARGGRAGDAPRRARGGGGRGSAIAVGDRALDSPRDELATTTTTITITSTITTTTASTTTSTSAELELEARRMLALARIRQYGDAVLRMKAREVETVDDDVRRLAARMTDLMHEAQGVGLAATQVGVLRRLFVFSDEGEDRVIVNPVITSRSSETEVDDEGCLSLREVLVPVERSCAVTIEGLDENGEPVKLELELPSARVVQHELDHLDGVLIVDRTDDESRRAALAKLRPQPVLR